MDAIWTDLAEAARGVLGFISGTYGKGALVAGLLSLAIWACIEYLFVPLFLLPGFRKAQPVAHALRPLVAMLLSMVIILKLHESGTLDFGVGPSAWLTAAIYAIVGGALVPPLHRLIKAKAPGMTVKSQAAPGPTIPPSGEGT